MFERFRQRSTEFERLDTGDYTDAEYRRWQREMRFVHGIFGETRALKSTLGKAVASQKEKVSVLDVGAGSGELLCQIASGLGRFSMLAGVEINQTAAESIAERGFPSVRADALKLPFADGSFDHVFCTLFLHHLDDGPAVELIREMARVAKRRIFVVDLNRHPTAYYTYQILGRIFLQRFTREDGALSILRARTPAELLGLASQAGLRDARVEHSRVNRLVLSGRGCCDE